MTEQLISTPSVTAGSTKIRRSKLAAISILARSNVSELARPMPMLEPSVAGLINSGNRTYL